MQVFISHWKVMKLIPVISLLISAHYVCATNYTDCNGERKPIGFNVVGCDTPPCKFVRSQTAILFLDFEADEDIIDLKPQMRIRAMGIDTLYPLPQKDACMDIINGECPLDKGEEVTYKLEMPISPIYPKLSFQGEFSLISSDRTVACVKVNGVVVDP